MAEVVGSNPIGSTAPRHHDRPPTRASSCHDTTVRYAVRVPAGAGMKREGIGMYGRRIAAPVGQAARTARRSLLVGPPRVDRSTLARADVQRRGGSILDLRDPLEGERAAAAADTTLAARTPPVAVLEHDRPRTPSPPTERKVHDADPHHRLP